MTHKYRKDYLTKIKGSKNWYIQFYIKDIYKDLPKIKNDPRWANRRNYLLSLETHDYSIAVKKVDEILKDIGIRSTPHKKLSQGPTAYFEVLKDLKVKTDNELDELYDIFTEMRNDSLQEIYETSEVEISNEEQYNHYQNAIDAIQREISERSDRFNVKPHPHHITLMAVSNEYKEDLVSQGKDKKTLSKLHHAVRKFLEFLKRNDVELRLIKSRIVNDYVRYSREKNVAEGTFRSEIWILSKVFKFAKNQEYLESEVNPFKDVEIKGFKEKVDRDTFTKEMLENIIKAIKEDNNMLQLVMISYYTGMRISEVVSAKFISINDVLCFDVATEGGKTKAAKRIIPIHSELLKWLAKKYDFNFDKHLNFNGKTANAIGKKFGRIKTKVLNKLNVSKEEQIHYVHHSFRHGFATMILEKGFEEIEFADLSGHSKSYLGKTEAARTYFKSQKLPKLIQMIESIPKLEI